MRSPLRTRGPFGSSPGTSHSSSSVLVALAVTAAASVSACGTGFDSPTSQVYNAPAGTDIREGEVKVLSAVIVTDEEGAATLSAGLVGTDTDDALVGIEVTDSEDMPVTTEIAGGSVKIPADELVQTAEDSEIAIAGDGLEPGTLVDVAFTFERAGPVSGSLIIMAAEGAYADVPVPAAPSNVQGAGG